MTDLFDIPEENPIKFDRWGRYLIASPVTGKQVSWTRATTFAKAIMDSFALNLWQQRMTAKGMSIRPDLVAMASTMDVTMDKDRFNDLVEQAKDAAGHKVAANVGTAVHSFIEEYDSGQTSIEDIPNTYREDVLAYNKALSDHGLAVIPDLQERVTCVLQYGVAGRMDKVIVDKDGKYRIGDVKSGKDLSFGWLEIAIQLAVYQMGINSSGVWNQQTQNWNRPLQVETDYAVVMHVPAGTGSCKLYKVDLEAGRRAALLCATVRDWRKLKGLAVPYEESLGRTPVLAVMPSVPETAPGPAQAPVPSWEDRFRAVSSRGEASSLYRQAVKVFGEGSAELSRLVKIGMSSLGITQ